MTPPPVALGLIFCEKVIIEEGTRNATLVTTFTKVYADRFPSPPQHFVVYAVLTDGLGDATIELIITHLGTNETVYSRSLNTRFTDRLAEFRLLLRFQDFSFPESGLYQFTLLVDGEWVTQRRLHVAERKDSP
jgi:hypothetical protein